MENIKNKNKNKRILKKFLESSRDKSDFDDEKINFKPLISEIPKSKLQNLIQKIQKYLKNVELLNNNNDIDSIYDKITVCDSDNFNFSELSFILDDDNILNHKIFKKIKKSKKNKKNLKIKKKQKAKKQHTTKKQNLHKSNIKNKAKKNKT